MWGRHTLKTGFYNHHSFKAQNRGTGGLNFGGPGAMNFANNTSNPIDSGFGFANAALGIINSYTQMSRFMEGSFVYNNREAYIQDNWKVNSKLTLDYGVRLRAPAAAVRRAAAGGRTSCRRRGIRRRRRRSTSPGCANGVYPCSGTNRQAMDPRTGQFLGPLSALSIGQLVPGTGNLTNGIFLAGQGIVKTTYTWPTLALAPRFGFAYDVSGEQRFIWRGATGLFYDRPDGNSIYGLVANPPNSSAVTINFGQLQNLTSNIIGPAGADGLRVRRQAAVVGAVEHGRADGAAVVVGAGRVVRRSVRLQPGADRRHQSGRHRGGVPGAEPGSGRSTRPCPGQCRRDGSDARVIAATARSTSSGAVAGTSTIRSRRPSTAGSATGCRSASTGRSACRTRPTPARGWSTARRLRCSYRADQEEADELLGRGQLQRHTIKGNFVWDLPDLSGGTERGQAACSRRWPTTGSCRASTPGSPAIATAIGYSYQGGGGNVNITGSPNYGGRVVINGDPGSGCSSNQYTAVQHGGVRRTAGGSVGLESGQNYLTGCFENFMDLAIARNFRLGGNRLVQLRLEMFNAFNTVVYSARNTTINIQSPTDPTVTNPTIRRGGQPGARARIRPTDAGFGAATNAFAPAVDAGADSVPVLARICRRHGGHTDHADLETQRDADRRGSHTSRWAGLQRARPFFHVTRWLLTARTSTSSGRSWRRSSPVSPLFGMIAAPAPGGADARGRPRRRARSGRHQGRRGTYYVFVTGGRAGQGIIPIKTSTDLRRWQNAGYVMPALPEWAAREIPQARNAWAPDISVLNGKFHLYYSVSSFGSRNSAIGLATNRTLDPDERRTIGWVDEGMVLRSYVEKDDWNAIDPNLVIEDEKNVWLTWGSFWGGIKMRRVDPATGKLSDTDTTMHALSSRAREQPTNGSVEAPFIVRHGDYWYLFVSFDRCCRGADSTYNVVVGRSRVITGPLCRQGRRRR